MANRTKKEEKKRGKPYPTKTLPEEKWNELVNYYEDTTHDERLKESLAPELKKMEKRIKELKKEAEKEKEERKKESEEDEKKD
jgi:hypothetical protein